MAKKTQPRKSGTQKKKQTNKNPTQQEGWISQRTGMLVIGAVSLALAVWTTVQIAPALGLGEGLLWGFGFGAAIWVVFFGFQWFSKWLRGR